MLQGTDKALFETSCLMVHNSVTSILKSNLNNHLLEINSVLESYSSTIIKSIHEPLCIVKEKIGIFLN